VEKPGPNRKKMANIRERIALHFRRGFAVETNGTNLLLNCTFTAFLVSDEYLKFDVQNSLALAQAATMAVNCGKSTLKQEVRKVLSGAKHSEEKIKAQTVSFFFQIDRCPHQYTACVLRVSIIELVIEKLHPHFLVCGNIIVQNTVLFLSRAFMTAQVSAETKFKP
jgi:hypothetical protein